MSATASFGSSDEFKLDRAILIYSGRVRSFATVHQVEGPAEQPALGPGFPASRAGIRQLVDALGKNEEFAGFIHPRILYIGKGVTIWWWPNAPRRVWFEATKDNLDDDADERIKPIGKRSAITAHPDLVFARNERAWFVFALGKNGRPQPEDRVFQAPYFNVYDTGVICEGNVHPPAIDEDGAVEAHERIFFDTRFTHPNTHRLAKWKGGAHALWTHLLNRGPAIKTFPTDALLDLKLRLKDLPARIRRTEG